MSRSTTSGSGDASLTWLRLLNLVNALRALPSAPGLDAVEERGLNGLAAIRAAGAKATVRGAMRPSPDASTSTAHGCLKRLQRKGPITLHGDGTDRRVRIVEPTGPANAWFARLGQCLNLAARDG